MKAKSEALRQAFESGSPRYSSCESSVDIREDTPLLGMEFPLDGNTLAAGPHERGTEMDTSKVDGRFDARREFEGVGIVALRHSDVAPRERSVKRVVVIEDNVDAANSLQDVLELCGHEVAVAYDGPRGVALARDTRPDIVLCDIGLPGMDGYAVARALRADPRLADTRLEALSGYARREDLERAIEAGFDGHLKKPPSIEQLEQLLAQLTPKRV